MVISQTTQSQSQKSIRKPLTHPIYDVKMVVLKEKGVAESLLNIMEGINQVVNQKMENQKYMDYVAMYATLRAKGFSHEASVSGLKAFLEGIKKI